MAAALIRIDQPSHSTTPNGTAGFSRDDLEISKLVQLSNDNDLGVRAHFWEITDQPDLSAPVSLSNPLAPNPTFTPVAAGTYRIKLRVNEGRTGEVDIRLAVIREVDSTRFPAAGEQDEANWDDPDTSAPNERGWWRALKDKFAAGGGGGGALAFTPVKAANYTAVAEDLVRFDPSGGTFTITMPAGPSANDRVGIKNVTVSVTAITVSGNGNPVEDPASFVLPGSVSVGGNGLALTYQWSGAEWLII